MGSGGISGWVGLRPRRRGFCAELSKAMLTREDRALLTGVASILTHFDRRVGGGMDVGGIAGGI